ncbi:MAG: porin [Amphritea sp.]
MKKSLIALAVAGALTAPIVAQADATLYGVAQFRLIDEDTKSLNANQAKTRLGVKGTVDNDIEGLTTGYQFEWEFSGANNDADGVSDLRKSLVFLKGAYGQATFGQQNNPAAAVKKADVFNRNSGVFSQNSDRIGNAVTYVTPKISGFEAYAGFTADGADDTSSEDVDSYIVGANYSAGGLGLSVSYNETNNDTTNTDLEVVGFGASYTMGDLYLGAMYQTTDADALAVDGDGDPINDTDVVDVAVKYNIGKFTVGAGFVQEDVDGASDESERSLVAVNYALGSSASLNIEYADYNSFAEENDQGNDQLVLQYTIGF